MSELEKFLQQAAERMKERLQEQQAAQQRTERRPSRPIHQVERAAPQYDDDEILEAELSDQPPPRPVSPKKRLSPLEESGARQRPAQPDQRLSEHLSGKQPAKERMTERLHQVFDHAIGQLGQRPKSTIASPTIFGSPGQTGLSSEVDRREKATSPLVQMLKEPDSLRAAFIVGEIFKRKF